MNPTPHWHAAGQRLIAALTGEVPASEVPAAEDSAGATSASVTEWLASLTTRLPLHQTLAVVEHLFGVLPLLQAHFGDGDGPWASAQEGREPTSLGFFTPSPEFALQQAAVAAKLNGSQATLEGRVRVAGTGSTASLLLIGSKNGGSEDGSSKDGKFRLAWLPHNTPGVTGQDVQSGAQWLTLENVEIGGDSFSQPFSLELEGDFAQHLDAYGALYAFVVSRYAATGVRALRRALRTNTHKGTPFHQSQILAMDLTGLEVENGLITAAVKDHFAHPPVDCTSNKKGTATKVTNGGLALAAAASKNLSQILRKHDQWRDQGGLMVDDFLKNPGEASRVLGVFLGGPLLLESELARTLGI